MEIEQINYTLQELMERQTIKHLTTGAVGRNMILLEDSPDTKTNSHLLHKLLFRLENMEQPYTVLLLGKNNKLTETDMKKGFYYQDEVGGNVQDVLVDRYVGSFSTPVLAIEREYNFSNVYKGIDRLNSLRLLGRFTYISDEARERHNDETNTEDISIDHDIFTNIIYVSFSDGINKTLSDMETIKEKMESLNRNNYNNNFKYYYHHVNLSRSDNLLVVENQAIGNDLEFNTEKETIGFKNEIPRYSVAYNFAINNLASQLVFNVINTIITNQDTIDYSKLVTDINGHSFKEYYIPVDISHFELYEDLLNFNGTNNLSSSEFTETINEIQQQMLPNYAELSQQVLDTMKPLFSVGFVPSTVPNLIRSTIFNNRGQIISEDYYTKLVKDLIESNLTLANIKILSKNIDSELKENIQKIIANFGSSILNNNMATSVSSVVEVALRYDTSNVNATHTAIDQFIEPNNCKKRVPYLDIFLAMLLPLIIDQWA